MVAYIHKAQSNREGNVLRERGNLGEGTFLTTISIIRHGIIVMELHLIALQTTGKEKRRKEKISLSPI